MSDNIISPLVDSIYNTCKLSIRAINKALGLNTIDFKQLFVELGICNKSKQYPKLYNVLNNDYFKVYQFEIPTGLSVEDFKKHTEAIAHFMNVDDISIVRNNKLVEIKILTSTPAANYDIEEHKRNDFKIPLGYDLNTNKLVLWDITSNNNCHCYIAGSSGGAGMILLMVTQLPSHEIMPNTIKCNINTVIGLKTIDEIRSDIIAPDGALHKLKGNGHSKLFDGEHQGIEYQGLYIDKETMKTIIKANLKQNKKS